MYKASIPCPCVHIQAKPKKDEDAASIAAKANLDIFAVEDVCGPTCDLWAVASAVAMVKG